MNELVRLIMEKTGVTEEQAAKAAETAAGFIKDRLPSNLGSQVDNILGSGKSEGTLGGITRKAGSVFGPE